MCFIKNVVFIIIAQGFSTFIIEFRINEANFQTLVRTDVFLPALAVALQLAQALEPYIKEYERKKYKIE